MYNKELFERVCNLTCTFEDVYIDASSLEYDKKSPFKKYYNLDTIINAITKYKNKEWTDLFLSHWACLYLWIISGGFDDDIDEDLSEVEYFIKETITDNLDGLSFIDDNYVYDKQNQIDLDKWIEEYKTLDKMLKSASKLVGYTAMIGEYDDIKDERYVLLINNESKEYSLIYVFYDNLENDIFTEISRDDFIAKEKDLVKKGYKLLHYKEDFYYDETKI